MTKKPATLTLLLALAIPVLPSLAAPAAKSGQAPPKPIATRFKIKKKPIRKGDPFSVTITPREKSFIFLFYVDAEDRAVSLYPGKTENFEIISPDDPLEVTSITNNSIKIDDKQGKIITVAVRFSAEGKKVKGKVLKPTDFSKEKPYQHMLDIKGQDLIERLEFMRADHPRDIHILVEEAPKAVTK